MRLLALRNVSIVSIAMFNFSFHLLNLLPFFAAFFFLSLSLFSSLLSFLSPVSFLILLTYPPSVELACISPENGQKKILLVNLPQVSCACLAT